MTTHFRTRASRLAAVVALALAALPGSAQSRSEQAEVVMRQAVEAMGGAEAIGAIENLAVRATWTGPKGGQITTDTWSILPDRTFYRESFQQHVTERTLVGDVAWKRGPGEGELALLTEPHEAASLRQREIHLMLANFVERYRNHKVLGTEIRAGESCALMEMADQWDQMGSICFDLDSSLPREVTFRRPPATGSARVVITLDDWSEVGGVMFPSTLTRTEGTETWVVRVVSIEMGVVDPAIFEIPAEIQR